MKPVTLRINSKIVDLYGEESLGLDFGIMDIEDISKIVGGISVNFTVPATANNCSIFGKPTEINSLSKLPYRILDVKLYVDGLDINVDSCEIISANSDEIEIRLFTSAATLFNALKTSKMSDLDLRDYDHYINGDTIQARLNASDGVVYPLLNSMQIQNTNLLNDTDNLIRSSTMLPCLYADSAIEKIFGSLGYSVINKIDLKGNKVVFPPVLDFRRNKNNRRYLGRATNPTDTITVQPIDIYPIYFNTFFPDSDSAGEQEFFRNIFPLPILQDQLNMFISDNIKRIKISLTFYIYNPNSSAISIDTYWITNAFFGGNQKTRRLTNHIIPAGQTVLIDESIEVKDIKEFYVLRFVCLAGSGSSFGQITLPDLTIEECEIKQGGLIRYDTAPITHQIKNMRYLNANSLINEEWTWAEFLKEYLSLFNAVPFVNTLRKEVTLSNIGEVLDNIGTAYNWTNKVDYTEPIDVTFKPDTVGILNNFTFDEIVKRQGDDLNGDSPAEVTPLSEANFTLAIDNENLGEEVTLIESKFCSSLQSDVMQGKNVANVPLFVEIQAATPNNRPTKYTRNEMNQAFLLVRQGDGTIDFRKDANDFTPSLFTISDYYIAWYIDDDQELNLGWGNSLVSVFYKFFTNALTNYKKISIRLNLNPVDIRTLDFQRPVYISGVYYYINAVNGYDPINGGSTEVELIKLNPYG